MKIIFVRHGETKTNALNEIRKKKNEPTLAYDLDDTKNILNDKGIKQATETGKYLNKFYKFDLIISSPRIRTIQTAELIAKKVNYKKEIITNNLIKELDVLEKYTGDNNKEEREKISDIWNKKLNNEKDPFRYVELFKKYLRYSYKKFQGVEYDDYIKNLTKFLNQLKNTIIEAKKCILVVLHGGELYYLEHLITNTYDSVNFIPYNSNEKSGGNCNIMMCTLENNKFKLVMPRNSNHLKNIID